MTDGPSPDGYGYRYTVAAVFDGPDPDGPTAVGKIRYDNGVSDVKTDDGTSLWFRHAIYQKATSVSLSIESAEGDTFDCGAVAVSG